jgi:hypothetical protein
MEQVKTQQAIQFTLHPSGQLSFTGEITTPEQMEVVQSLVNASDYRKQLTNQVERMTTADSKWIGAITAFMILLGLFCVTLSVMRGISNFSHQQERQC